MNLVAFMNSQKDLRWQEKAMRASVVAITGAALACAGAAVAMAIVQGLLLGVLGIGAFQLSQQRQQLCRFLSADLRMTVMATWAPPTVEPMKVKDEDADLPETPCSAQTPAIKAPAPTGQSQKAPSPASSVSPPSNSSKRNQVAADLKAFGEAMGALRFRPAETTPKEPKEPGRVAKALSGGAALDLLRGVAPEAEESGWKTPEPGTEAPAPVIELTGPRAAELRRSVQRLLNRVCPENVGKIVEQLADIKLVDSQELSFVIKTLFKRALLDPHYCETYADLAFGLYTVSQVPAGDANVPFSSLLVGVCHAEFEALRTRYKETLEETASCEDPEEIEFEIKKTKDKMLASMSLIGNLFLRGLMSASAIAAVVTDLVSARDGALAPADYEVECVCELLKSVGATLQADASSELVIVAAFRRLAELRKAKNAEGKDLYCKRLQFVMQDLVDLREAGWVKKVFKSAAKTKDEIRTDAANEEELKHNGEDGVQRIVAGLRPSVIAGTKVSWGENLDVTPVQGGPSSPPLQPQQAPKESSPKPPSPSERSITVVQLPWGWAGKIIGPRGETARTMQEDTGARIWVDRAASQARVTGSPEAVAAAEVAIKALLPPAGSAEFRQPSTDEETSAGSTTNSSTESDSTWERPRNRSERGRAEQSSSKVARRRDVGEGREAGKSGSGGQHRRGR